MMKQLSKIWIGVFCISLLGSWGVLWLERAPPVDEISKTYQGIYGVWTTFGG